MTVEKEQEIVLGSEQKTISEPLVSSTDQVVRRWLVTFGEICQREITPALIAIWIRELSDIPPQTLERACRRVLDTWIYPEIPRPGNIRAQVIEADRVADDLEAERAWQEALRIAGQYGLDYSVASAEKITDPHLEAAVRGAGGWHWIESCPEEQLQWAKKAFVEIYRKRKSAANLLELPSSEEARLLLRSIAAVGAKKALPRRAS